MKKERSLIAKKQELNLFNIDAKDNNGMTCLMKAAMNGYIDIVDLLL